MIEEAYVTLASESGLQLTLKIWKYHCVLTLLSMGNSIVKIFFSSYVQLNISHARNVHSLGVQGLLKKEKGLKKN